MTTDFPDFLIHSGLDAHSALTRGPRAACGCFRSRGQDLRRARHRRRRPYKGKRNG